MRYDLVAAAVRVALPDRGRVLDVGCGSCLVADRLGDIDATYVGVDFGGHHVRYARERFSAAPPASLRVVIGRCGAEALPFPDGSVDVVVLSEVIEHLLRPELAVWEVARVLRPGGTFVMTTNNASEAPCRSPLSHLFAWVEKAWGATHPTLISLRPWLWPHPLDREILPEGAPDVWLPHTHHIYAETAALFAAAGLVPTRWSTFEFPPPQAATARWLEGRGATGRRAVDAVEWICTRTPGVRRLGCHLLVVSTRLHDPVTPTPPPGVWPGPFSP
jgi:SAM-dependent methyltransferase